MWCKLAHYVVTLKLVEHLYIKETRVYRLINEKIYSFITNSWLVLDSFSSSSFHIINFWYTLKQKNDNLITFWRCYFIKKETKHCQKKFKKWWKEDPLASLWRKLQPPWVLTSFHLPSIAFLNFSHYFSCSQIDLLFYYIFICPITCTYILHMHTHIVEDTSTWVILKYDFMNLTT